MLLEDAGLLCEEDKEVLLSRKLINKIKEDEEKWKQDQEGRGGKPRRRTKDCWTNKHLDIDFS